MKTISLICLYLTMFAYNSNSQTITNYSFAASSGSFTALSGATSPGFAGNVDDGYWNAIPIGFDFWYMGIRYTTVSASTNGWLTLGTNITDATYANSLANGGAPRPVIAPLWDDLDIQASNNFSYLTSGVVGSRILTLQFLNQQWNYQATGNTISFQVKLYESTGRVQFIYKQESGAVNIASASIGIAGTSTGAGNFLSLNGTGTTPSASSTVETATLGSKPATGQTYSFTSSAPTSPTTLTFTNVSMSGMTLNWVDNSSNESGFVIYRSTDGTNYSFVAQTAANTTSSIQTGMSGNILYYWRVYSLREGALSTALTGSKTTACTAPAAPTVTTPVTYCQNATASQLTATGSNLLWGGTSISGSVGGTGTLATTTFVDGVNATNNKKTNFTTTAADVTITTVDYYLPAWQNVNGLNLAIFNSVGTVIATSTTTSSQTAGATAVKISNTFNYNITTAGNYSIGINSGIGNIGSDNPSYPITEVTGTINVTGVSVAGFRCFNNIQFTTGGGSATAPTPLTTTVGSTNYLVTQTVGGCVSAPATIAVVVTAPNILQIPTSNLVANYKFSGNANDATGNNNGTLQNAALQTNDRFNLSNRAYAMNGTSQYVSTATSYVNPSSFTISTWFKTSSSTGGKLIGFGNTQVGASGQYDRHIYMNNAGQIYFGVYPGSVVTVNSALSYNDNNWHLATATLSAGTGMILYVDGVQVGSNPSTTTGENFTGYWKIGYDNLSGWTSQPTSNYFNGTLDDVLIYDRALTASEISTLYVSPDGAGNNGPVCTGSSITLSATSLGGATYAWTGPNGFSSTSQNPVFTYTSAAAGVYTVEVTSAGCVATAYTTVTSTNGTGQWTGNVSTDWADVNNWCSGVLPTSTTNVTITSSATRMPVISSSIACNNLIINNGATINIGAAGTLNIAGTFTNAGTVTNVGTVNFNGTSGQQTYSGLTSFHNLTVTNTNGILLPAPVVINNNLVITSGTLNANNFDISVKGNWTNNASVNAFAAGTGTVTFNGTTAQVIGGSFATGFNNLTSSNSASSVTLAVNAAISGNLSVANGILDLAAFTANRNSAGGNLTVSNNATLKIGGTNTYPINYTTNTLVVASTVEYSGTNQIVSNQVYGNLTLSSSSGAAVKTMPPTVLAVIGNLTSNIGVGTAVTFTAASNITVSGTVNLGTSTTFNGDSYLHGFAGNWTNNGVFNGNTGTARFNGPGTTIAGSGTQNFNNLTIAASLINFSSSSISVSGNLATTGSGSFIQASGGTLTMTGASKTISGSGISLDNLSVTGSVSTIESFTLTGNLSVSGSLTSTAGTITMSGASKQISGAGTKNFSTLYVTGSITTAVDFSIASGLTVAGSLAASAGTATFTGTSSLSGTANLYNTNVNGTALKLSANSVLGVAGALSFTTGILDVTTSTPNTVNFNSTGAQNINAITYHNLLFSNGNNKTAIAGLTVNGNITISNGTTFTPGAFTHLIYNDWNNYGTFTAGSSTIKFVGTQDANINGPTIFNIMEVDHTVSTTSIILLSDVSANIVNMTLGGILTGTNTITITSTRTGNGIILGNIKRTHAFTTGIAYAFEGPENTITFSTVSAVTSVTVSVAKGQVSDFPFGGSIRRVYNISVPAGTYNATLRLHYEDDELNGSNESSMGLWNYSGAVWSAIGKTGNSSVSNYVEQSGLTNITNRWTCSDNSNLVQWNGSISTDWNTAANWTVLQGSASRPPSATDIVDLGTATFTNHPTISTAVTVKNINFGDVQALTLSMASGGSLTSGNIHGSWSSAVTHTINANNQTITINGDLSLSNGTSGHVINLNIGSGSVAVGGSLTQSGGANIIFGGAGNLGIAADYNYVNGTFTANTGTVTYNGTLSQVIGAVSYHNLTINKASSSATLNNDLSITGSLSVSGGELNNMSTLEVAGNINVSPGAILYNSNIIKIGGNWANYGTYYGSATVIFNGSGTQTISATTFNNLEFNKPVGSVAELIGDVILKGNLVGTSGTLDIKSFFFNRDIPGGSATMTDNATLIIAVDNAPNKFASYSMAPGSTVVFNGTGTQHLLLPGLEYGNLVFRNTGNKILYTATTVKGNLSIESGASFDAGANTITLHGDWLNSGTFIPSTSTLIIRGTGKNISGNTTFHRMSVYGSYTFLSNITIDNILVINPTGELYGGSSIHTTMNGDLMNKGILYTLGTTTFTGNILQTLSLINAVQTVALTVNFNGSVSPVLNSTSVPQFGFLNINNTGGVNPSVGWNILYSLTVSNGASFNGGNSTHNLLGSLTNNGTITTSGIFNFIPSTPATINVGTGFSSTGTVVFGGTGGLTLAGTPAALNNVIVSNTNVAGVTASSAWALGNNLTINNGSALNAGNYSHSVQGNIMNLGTISSGTSTFTMNGTGVQDIYSASPFNNLSINKSAGTTMLSSNVSVNNILNFISGKIQTGSNAVVQPAGGTVTGAAQNTGWVNGKLQRTIVTGATSKAFEIGDASNFTPVTVAFSNVSTSGTLTAFTTPGDHPAISSAIINETKSVNRFWTLANSGISFTNYTATYNFAGTDIDAGSSTASFGVGLYNGSSWIMPVIASPNTTNIQATNVTTVGEFAIGEVCNQGTAINYTASPYCSNGGTANVTLTGTVGGTFSSTTGLTIDAATGAIDLAASLPGSYLVTYTVDAFGGCPLYMTSANISISAAAAATISYSGSPYCSNAGTATPMFSGTSGGTFTSTTGLILDANTGDVNLSASTAGTYTVTYSVSAAGGCSIFNTTASITITAAPAASISYPASPYCANAGSIPVSFSGTTGGTFTSTAGLSIDATTGAVDLAASSTGTYTVTYTIATSGGCSQFQVSTSISIVVAGTWTGSVNSDWNEAGNWLCGQIPGSSTNVHILGNLSIYPVISSTVALHDIIIETGASVQVNGGIMQIGGNIINAGIFNTTAGTIEFNGSSAQTIPTGAFENNSIQNLVISNNTSLEATDTLTGTLTIAAGKTFATNDNLVLKSDANGTARIATLPVDGSGNATAFITGNVSIERHLPMRKAWRLLSAPLKTAGSPTINAAWQEGVSSAFINNPNPGYGVFIQGGSSVNGFDQGLTSNASIKIFNQTTNNFVALPPVPGTNMPIANYPGYFLYVRGDRSIDLMQGNAAATTATTLRMQGQINTGSQITTVHGTSYTVFGNPYPSAIDFETLTKNNVKNAFYVWDPKLSGTFGLGGYVTFSWNNGTGMYDATTAASPVSKYIPSGEAIIIESADAVNPGTITVKESDKTANGSDAVFGTPNSLNQQLRVNLFAVNADATTSLLDGVLTTYDGDNLNIVDNNDAKKLNGGSENIGLKRDTKMLAIERRKTIHVSDTSFLNIYQMKVQQYQLEITANNLNLTGAIAVLKDSYSNTTNDLPLDMNGTTKVNFSINADPASYAINRFMIVFRTNVVLPVTFKTVKAYKQQEDIAVEWNTENEINIASYDVERSIDGRSFSKIHNTPAKATNGGSSNYIFIDTNPVDGNNYYRIRSVENDGRTGYSNIVKVAMEKVKGTPAITVYPNPVTGNTIGIQFTNVAQGNYSLQLFNAMGQLVANKTIVYNGTSATEHFEVDAQFAAGKYELKLTGDNMKIVTPVIKR